MSYDQQILQIFTEVGERGISVKLLSKHLYNMNVSLFSTPDLESLMSYVRKYVIRNSKTDHSLLVKANKWGYYRLNTKKNADARQIMLEFKSPKEQVEEVGNEEQPDLSLDLFA